ncbi:hypothetical protein OH76DRAFT_1490589 [Lentinus brumalis]|uniref:F-box domain-containing protein n=1 Tax=Lentinus brumalis TaxID=2498619 RepID=A0A371CIJ1_9APHY|nr:hypothetical protein OH76DRAFT_1490589 [Polyporus brumalis]
MNSDDNFLDVINQLQDAFITCRKSMSLASLHKSIETIHRLKITVCREANDRVPVNTLPDEILLEVFKQSLLRKDPCPTVVLGYRSYGRVETRPLLLLTHVCRQWRSTALACSVLWQRIDCRNLEQFEEFALRRSAPGPISLFYLVPPSRLHTSNLLFPIPSLADRLRRLDIAYPAEAGYDNLHERLRSMHCPNLECLTVTKSNSSSDYANLAVLRTLICQAKLPRLRALAMTHVSEWLPSDLPPSLTHLFLSFLHYNGIPLSSILNILAHLPALEILHISHYNQVAQMADGQHGEPIQLPRLKLIILVNMPSLARSLALMRPLAIPSSCRVYLHHLYRSDSAISMLADSVISGLPATENTNRLTLAARFSNLEIVADGTSSGFWLNVKLSSAAGTEEDRSVWLSRLPTMFPLSTLSSLQLRLNLPGSTITQILRETICLTTLEVMIVFDDATQHGGADSEDSLIHICHALSQDDNRGSQSILCPALHSLTIVMPDYREDRTNTGDPYLVTCKSRPQAVKP